MEGGSAHARFDEESGFGSSRAEIVYVIEGDPSKHVYRACGCGCLGIGACGNPNLQAVTAAISERERAGAKIVRTADPRETARWLAAERKRQLQSHFREADRPPPQTPEKRKKQPTQGGLAAQTHDAN